MKLADLLPLSSSMTDVELKGYALVFNNSLRGALAQVEGGRPNAKHRTGPVALTDGRYLLCADLLSEIGPKGLYTDGFAQLPADLFDQVDVLTWDEAKALIPTPDPELQFA
jgi:hypothetical protein